MSRSWQLAADVAFALLAFVTTGIGFASWYSRIEFDPGVFASQYDSGIYRYRVLGRDLVWWVYQHVVHTNVLTGTHELDDPGRLYPAFLIVTGIAFVGLILVLRVAVRRAKVAEPGGTLVVWAVAAVVALTGYVVTPYDDLSYVLLVAFVLLATSARREAHWIAVAVAGIGLLDRETMLLGIPVLIAILSTRTEDRELRTVTIAAGAVMAAVYVLLRVAIGGSGSAIWDTILIGREVGSVRAWVGIALVGLLAVVWVRLAQLTGLGVGDRRALTIFYLLSLPYVAVIVLTGEWFELRLVIPLLLGDLAVRCGTSSDL